MDREPEQRRDLAPAQPAPNPMGGELFTVTERRTIKGFSGQQVQVVQVDRHQAIGSAPSRLYVDQLGFSTTLPNIHKV